jgi:hypothetical protein
MSYVGEKYKLAGNDGPGITNDHFELIKRVTQEGIAYDGVLRREFFSEDTPFKYNWNKEEFWFENMGFTEACKDGKEKAEEEGVVLLQAQPGLAERTILWHPGNWKPDITD